VTPAAQALAVELAAELDELRDANADVPPPPAAALDLLRRCGFPLLQIKESA